MYLSITVLVTVWKLNLIENSVATAKDSSDFDFQHVGSLLREENIISTFLQSCEECYAIFHHRSIIAVIPINTRKLFHLLQQVSGNISLPSNHLCLQK